MGPIKGPSQYDSAVIVRRVSRGPQFGTHDAERHQFLGQLYVRDLFKGIYTEESFRNLVNPNQFWIVITIFR